MTTALVIAVACAAFEFIVIVLLMRHLTGLTRFIMAQKDAGAYSVSHPQKPHELTDEEIVDASKRREDEEFMNILFGGTISDEQEGKYAAPDIIAS